ncbi:hypothetical protein SDRG_00066 [Saprolegnia diclina VS20]|uniref:F-box domain-containing protein n=1 Tax=Saprolegnia diclina (strain VS20) TaxID=1156394 RepID=T0SH60_SAPDV|nr:hypothetical protein SDRG_00066 [Saprolegnia diclina VS20]EQC42327.1 hypothetical protein SDRG_00066 [Saprolegnia diclina VS20]|eukprot:XP_008603750.1 hypothetical protein SDRG_00066 [Saprolegnia diclina VS20]
MHHVITKRRKTVARSTLSNATLQHVAEYIRDTKDMTAFLAALPEPHQSAPLRALGVLLSAVRDRRFPQLDTNGSTMSELSSRLLVPDCITEDYDLRRAIATYASMAPRVPVAAKMSPWFCIPPQAQLEVATVQTRDELAYVTTHWSHQAVTLRVELGELVVDDVCRALQALPQLRCLDLTWPVSASVTQQAALFSNLMSSNVEELHLCYNKGSSAPWTKAVVDAFVAWTSSAVIKTLSLVRLCVAPGDAPVLAAALLGSKSLRSLHVEYGKVPRALFALGQRLPSQLTALTTYLDADCNVDGFLETISGSSLRTLEVAVTTRLSPKTTTRLCRVISSLTHLRHLGLWGALDLRPSAMTWLSQCLQQLATLRLRGTSVCDTGAMLLAMALPTCVRLQELCLFNQSCTHVAAKALAAAIPACPTLKVLDMSFNELGSVGLLALLPIMRCLDSLALRGSGIDDDGANVLCRMMHDTDHLRKLNLSANPLSTAAVLWVIRAVAESFVRDGVVDLREIVNDENDLNECWDFARETLPYSSWCKLDVLSY